VSRPAPQPRRSSLLPFYIVLGLVALAGAFLVYRQVSGGGGSAATTLAPVVLSPEELNRVPGISVGRPDAPVVVMEFADFQCPGCAQFARFSKPLLSDHIESGHVRFVYYDFPLVQIHANAMLAARAGRCANEQDRFWPYHDLLYGRQSQWSGAQRPVGLFVEYAGQVGLDASRFGECLRSDRYQTEVSQSYELGRSLQVDGTPTLFVNLKRVQQLPNSRAAWDALVRQEMGAAAPAGAATPAEAAPDSAR
jgi:protein-disulfide isomerase